MNAEPTRQATNAWAVEGDDSYNEGAPLQTASTELAQRPPEERETDRAV